MKEAIIHLYGFERPLAQRRVMVEKLTRAACEAYEIPPEQVTVYFFDLDRQNSANAGVLLADAAPQAPIRS